MKAREDIHIVTISDISTIGSGYNTLTIPLLDGLSKLGYKIKVCALMYDGREHPYDFSLIPCGNFHHAYGTLENMRQDWGVDVVIQALDIPIQEQFLEKLPERDFKFIGIYPIESDPVMFSTAMALQPIDKSFVISQFGADECAKVGLDAEHLRLGIDTESWRFPTDVERKNLRTSHGFDDDTFVVLTVADIQERKNLPRSMEIFADFNKKYPNSKYVLITREKLSVGWNLRDYAQKLGINRDVIIRERGLPFLQLWSYYAMSDAFLLTSKCEGLGLPLLESMSVGLPCVATRCTAIEELLSDGRGYLIDPVDIRDLSYIDPFGNSNRYFAKRSHGLDQLERVYRDPFDRNIPRKYVESRTWDAPVSQLDKAILELCG